MLEKAAHIGRQAALSAGAILRQNYLKPHQVTLKGAIDPVTETDLQSQETIIALIRQAFPDHGFLAEEERVGQGGANLGAGFKPAPTTYRWIIDPLDGTVNFAHGFPMFCVSIAFEAAGALEYGVIYDPLRDELFEAIRGRGATLNGQPIKVSTTDRLDRGLLATGFPYDIRERLPETLARLARILGVAQGVRRAGSAALDMAYVACGRFDGFWEENLKPWDTAAGCLLIEEAGGRITMFEGGVYDMHAPNIMATNSILHDRLLSCLNHKTLQTDEPSRVLKKPFYVGADGCKGGWFTIALTQGGQWQTGVCQDIAALWKKYHNASLILLDVPIGLKESGADERRCDKEARKILGPKRGTSVFPVPCRQAVYIDNYEDAKAENIRVTGKSLSVFAWGIVPKIQEVDRLVLGDATAREYIKEIHPELCFWALAGRPMQHKKNSELGFSERLQVLQSSYSQTDAIVEHALKNYPRKVVAKDDILDALVAAITALGLMDSLPELPEFDDRGLPMQMLYRSFDRG